MCYFEFTGGEETNLENIIVGLKASQGVPSLSLKKGENKHRYDMLRKE